MVSRMGLRSGANTSAHRSRCWRLGRGIEGAIGSIHKVDASYLSPHVNIASRMCAAAAQYGKSILMSSVFHDLLSKKAARYCRLVRALGRVPCAGVAGPLTPVLPQVDVIQVKGSKIPLPVYTYDVWEWRTKVCCPRCGGVGCALLTW